MKKSFLFSLVLIGNCLCSGALALPLEKELPQDDHSDELSDYGLFTGLKEPQTRQEQDVQFGTAMEHSQSNNQYATDRDKAFNEMFGDSEGITKRDDKRAPFAFGTALGYNSQGNQGDDYLNNLWKTYNNLYPGGSRRRTFQFGTALGHSQGNEQGQDYNEALNSKFHEVFGKRESLAQGENEEGGSWYEGETTED